MQWLSKCAPEERRSGPTLAPSAVWGRESAITSRPRVRAVVAGSRSDLVIRKAQFALATLLTVEAALVIAEADALAQKVRVTADGGVLPLARTFPSPFSAGAALVLGAVLGKLGE